MHPAIPGPGGWAAVSTILQLRRDPLATLITEGELLFGLARRPDARRLHLVVEEFLRRVDVLPWDRAIASHYGMVRYNLERQGRTMGPLDLLIAAHALGAAAVIVTNDKAFRHIDNLEVEDWTA